MASAETAKLWVRACYEAPVESIDEEIDMLREHGLGLSIETKPVSIGDLDLFEVTITGERPEPGNSIELWAARIFNEFGCDVWNDVPKPCAACEGAGCQHCSESAASGRAGVITPSLDFDYFYPAGGGA